MKKKATKGVLKQKRFLKIPTFAKTAMKISIKERRDRQKKACNALMYGASADQARRILAGSEGLTMQECTEIASTKAKGIVESAAQVAKEALSEASLEQACEEILADRRQSNPKTLMGAQKVPMLSVIPPASLIAQGIAMRYGAFLAPRADGTRGYGPYNWRDQPIEAHIYIDAAMRHLLQWQDGDDYEIIRDDSGNEISCVSHLGFALATIGILIDAIENNTCIDDRPKVRRQVATHMLARHKMETRK